MLEKYLSLRQREVNAFLTKKLFTKNKIVKKSRLFAAIKYSLMNGGKRFRPVLCLAAAEVCGCNYRKAMLPAIAMEAFHTYTLIHDDLPAMDDDKLRRGKPTCHIAFDEATAILAGDALQALAFEWLAESKPAAPFFAKDLVLELAKAAGVEGVVMGQTLDMESEGNVPDNKILKTIHFYKTAVLIRASVRIGAMMAGADKRCLMALSEYGENLGIAFQFADDVLNATSTPEKLGKGAGTDADRKKMTAVALFGVTKAKKILEEYTEKAIRALIVFKSRGIILEKIARYNLERTC